MKDRLCRREAMETTAPERFESGEGAPAHLILVVPLHFFL